jgi:hypothetical protein
MAYYRLGRDREALEILKATADEDRTANSRLGSLLSLALVQLRLGQLDAARETIQAARPTTEESTWDARPWGIGTSLWREVQAAMEVAGVDEAIPELPPPYAQWPTATGRRAQSATTRGASVAPTEASKQPSSKWSVTSTVASPAPRER